MNQKQKTFSKNGERITMDKYEYKIRTEEIKELISQREYARAVEIADTIDWRRVKSVMMLCTISDLYKINKRYEDSRDLLLLAYARNPGGRTIVYALCELSIKMGELDQAQEYWKEFVNIAPRDPGRYVLRYKIYEAEGVNLEERVTVLEELKKHDYREKWVYELAYLYHRMGLVSKCVDECDELIIWFGEGKYVIRAMELKMLHQPLTPQQQEKYDSFFAPVVEEVQPKIPMEEVQAEEIPQESVAMEEEQKEEVSGSTSIWSGQEVAVAMEPLGVDMAATRVFPTEEIDIQVKTMDPNSQYNTINLQQEVAAGIQEILAQEEGNKEIIRTLMEPMMQTDRMDGEASTRVMDASKIRQEIADKEEEQTLEENTRVWKSEEIQEPEEENTRVWNKEEVEALATHREDLSEEQEEGLPIAEEMADTEEETEIEEDIPAENDLQNVSLQEDVAIEEQSEDKTAQMVMAQMRKAAEEPPKEIAEVISMEGDGQFRFFVPEKAMVEQQVSGQLSIDDIMAEWERVKKELEEKNKQKLVQRVKENTNPMFNEFEASLRDDLLEQLESGRSMESVIAEAEGRSYEEAEIPVPDSLQDEDADGEDYEAISVEEAENAVEWEPESVEEVFDEEFPESALEEIDRVKEEEESLQEEIQQLVEETEQENAAYRQDTVIGPEDVVEELEELEEWETLEEEAAVEEEELPDFETESLEETAEQESIEEEIPEEPEELNIMEGIDWEESEEAEEEALEEDELPEEIHEEETTTEVSPEPETEEEELAEPEVFENDGEEAEAESVVSKSDVTEPVETEGKNTAAPMKKRPKKLRNLTKEERELFDSYIQGKTSKAQLIHAIDNISMAAYTGNVIITGVEGLDTLGLAKSIIREVQMTDSNFSGKVAKISGEAFNKRNVSEVMSGLQNGALIIQNAYQMNGQTVNQLYKELQQENLGIVVIMEGLCKKINAFLAKNAVLKECFTARIDMETLNNNDLVEFAKKYAAENEFSMDEMAEMELHRIIDERQTSDHAVTMVEVKEIMDEAMDSASRKSIGHFFDILAGKRYDEEDMIIIRSKDFR